MKCDEVEMKMIDYLGNNLSNEMREEIEKHLGTCERCLDELKESQELLKLMERAEMVKPQDSLRVNFYHMLHSEIRKYSERDLNSKTLTTKWYRTVSFSIAAGVALLICGTFIGILLYSGLVKTKNMNEFAQLHSEVNALKKAALFTMMNEQSSSDRIQAVNYVDDLENADEPVLDVLIKTLNTDKNVNVRMAAAYALAKFADQRPVIDSLVASLGKQTEPILQVTLINILVERKEHSAIKPIQEIINDKNTLIEVKQVAEKGVKMLI